MPVYTAHHFWHKVDTRSRDQMIRFLRGHSRYSTANSWNNQHSYANCVKVTHLDIPDKIADAIFEMMDEGTAEEFHDHINQPIEDFAEDHEHRWQIHYNGRSDGYLVLYTGSTKPSPYKTVCYSCRQKNYQADTTTCGRCRGTDMRPFEGVEIQTSITGVDQEEDFETWTVDDLRARVRLVQEFDEACDQVVREAVWLAEHARIEERRREEVVTRHRKRIVTDDYNPFDEEGGWEPVQENA